MATRAVLLRPPYYQHLLCRLLQGYGVYRFQDKYGANVDGYSPIYTPDQWTPDGQVYKLGQKGLIAWCVTRLTVKGIGRVEPLTHIFLTPTHI